MDSNKEYTNNIEVDLKFLMIPDFAYKDNRLSALQLKIYAFINSFRGKYFCFSNTHLSEMFNVTPDGISLAIKALIEYGYIGATYKVKKDGGKIRFIKNLKDGTVPQSVLETDSSTFGKLTPVRFLNINDNKLKDNKLNNNKIIHRCITDKSANPSLFSEPTLQKSQVQDEIILTPRPSPTRTYGNGDVSFLIGYLKEKLGLPILDETDQMNRRYCWLAMNKFGGKDKFERIKKVQMIIDAASMNDFWKTKITSFKPLYYNGVNIISSNRDKMLREEQLLVNNPRVGAVRV